MNALLLALAMPLLLVAGATEDAGPNRAGFDVTVIEAKKEPGPVDPKLEHLRDVLDRSFKGYKSFRQVHRDKFSVQEGKTHSSTLAASQKLSIGLLAGGADGFLKVRLETGDLKTTIDVTDGGLFFQAARGPSGAALVIAIRASRIKGARTR
jgi:hypothetical protein